MYANGVPEGEDRAGLVVQLTLKVSLEDAEALAGLARVRGMNDAPTGAPILREYLPHVRAEWNRVRAAVAPPTTEEAV